MSVINVTRSSLPDFEEYCAEIRSIWDSRWLTGMADKHQQLEGELREYLGVSSISLIGSDPVRRAVRTPFSLSSMGFSLISAIPDGSPRL